MCNLKYVLLSRCLQKLFMQRYYISLWVSCNTQYLNATVHWRGQSCWTQMKCSNFHIRLRIWTEASKLMNYLVAYCKILLVFHNSMCWNLSGKVVFEAHILWRERFNWSISASECKLALFSRTHQIHESMEFISRDDGDHYVWFPRAESCLIITFTHNTFSAFVKVEFPIQQKKNKYTIWIFVVTNFSSKVWMMCLLA